MALTPKQRRFVEEYAKDCNATQAAIRAGYSEKSAYSIGDENLRKPEVAAAIAERAAKLTEAAEVTSVDVLRGLKTEAERTGEDASHAARVSAWGHLGKFLGMAVERSEVNARLEIVVRHE